MKKLYLIFATIMALCSASYVDKTTHPLGHLLQEYTTETVIDILEYDPHITFYPSTKPTMNNNQITVYVHGWGESQKSIPFLQANTDLLPGHVIGFNFRNALVDSVKKRDLLKTNFCQTDDIAALLMTLKVLDICHIHTFHLMGTSQGAGTIITAIARINRYNHHKKFFATLGISLEQATRIVEKIKSGTIVLNCPLLDLNLSIKHKLEPYHAAWLSPLVTYGIIPSLTHYIPSQDCPLKAARHLKALNIPLLVHFQKNNLMLGNKGEAQFYHAMQGPHTYLVLGNDGGYGHRGETLAPALHAFRKKYNGPHYTASSLLQKGTDLLAQPLTGKDDIVHYIEQTYANSTYSCTVKHNCPWQKKFAQYNTKEITKKLGYNPSIRLYQGDARVHGNDVTVYIHGYGDNHQFTIPFFMLNSYMLPGTVIGFNFQDVTENAFKLKIGKSSVGQSGDIATLSLVLKMLDECGVESFNLFGYSRGGATTVTTLGRLCSYDQHRLFFERIGITEQQAHRIITKVQKGTIVLNCPLIDSNAVAHYWFGRFDKFFMNSIIPRIMEHRAHEDQAIHAADAIQKMNFRILVHFQKNDKVLGNEPAIDACFYNNLKGPHTYLVIADDGGHLHSGKTLGKATQAFHKKYHAPYYPITKLIHDGTMLLASSPRSDAQVLEYITQMYS
jgi:pimeloyl-ACP methyl ester carboxylesterase